MARFIRKNVKVKKAKVVKAKKPLKREIPVKKEEPKKPQVEPVKPVDAVRCQCGEPVATELGQTTVCKKHIKAS